MKTHRTLAAVEADPDRIERRHRRELHLVRTSGDHIDLFGDPVPEELLAPYDLDGDGMIRSSQIQKKYCDRARNTRRCWNRIQLFLPELLITQTPHKVLEMSTAHGGMLDILRHYGHDVMGNDYANMMKDRPGKPSSFFRRANDEGFARAMDDHGNKLEAIAEQPDWPYRHITEALDLPMAIFDAGHTPYPFEDDAFDVLICIQAIEHYCHPRDWMKVVDEFCRVTRKTILLIPNPITPSLAMIEDYKAEYDKFMLEMRRYDRNGFMCTSCHMHWSQPQGFKLTAV